MQIHIYTRYWFILPVRIIIGKVTKLQKFTISTKIKKSRQVQSVSGSVYFRWYREFRPWSHTMFPSFFSNRFYSHSPSLWNPGHSQHLLQSFSNSLTIQDNHIQIIQFLQVLFYTGVLYKWGMHPTWPQVNKKKHSRQSTLHLQRVSAILQDRPHFTLCWPSFTCC